MVTNTQKVEDLNRENLIRLRAEVNIVADRLRRRLYSVYKEQFDASVIAGKPMRLRGDPQEIDALALEAALDAFGGEHLQLSDGKDG